MRFPLILAAITVGGAALCVPACDGTAPPNSVEANLAPNAGSLLALLANTSTPDSSRIAADKKFTERYGVADERRLQILEQILYAPGQPDEMRIYALDAFLGADKARVGTLMSLYLPRMQSPVLDHACSLAITLDDPRLVGPLVRSLARDVSTPRDKRPEIAPILHLAAKPDITAALLSVLEESRSNDARYAVLTVLPDLTDAEVVKIWIRNAKPRDDDSIMKTLQSTLRTFDYVPVGRNELDWSRKLLEPSYFTAVPQAHADLAKQKGYVYAPRFIGIIAYSHMIGGPAFQFGDRARVIADIEALLPDRHIARRATEEGAPPDDESLSGNLDKLSHADLLTISALLHNLTSPEFRKEVIRLGLKDMTDTVTEHGGLIAVRQAGSPLNTSLELVPYPAFDTGDDHTYRASDKLFAATPTGVAHFHLHFQQIKNEAIAGPGPGDLAYARANRVNCVVFTSIARNTFNADYYTPAGAVVDLGVYTAE